MILSHVLGFIREKKIIKTVLVSLSCQNQELTLIISCFLIHQMLDKIINLVFS